MLAEVRGQVLAARLDGAVVAVGGLGLMVRATPRTLMGLRVGSTARLATSLVVREDSLTLFGFETDDERDVFELLQTVSGVGPRLALAVLAVHDPDDLRRGVAAGDEAALMKVPGHRPQGRPADAARARRPAGAAARHARPPPPARPAPRRAGDGTREQVVAALVGLGWAQKQSEAAVDAVVGAGGAAADDPADLLRTALRGLART